MSKNLLGNTVYLTNAEYATLLSAGTVTLASGEVVTYSLNDTYIVPEQIDTEPTSGSTNTITSGAVYNALSNKQDSGNYAKTDSINTFTQEQIVKANMTVSGGSYMVDDGDGTTGSFDLSGISIMDTVFMFPEKDTGDYTFAMTDDVPTKTSQLTNDSGFVTENTTYELAGNNTANVQLINSKTREAQSITVNNISYSTSAGYASMLGTSGANYTKSTLDAALNNKVDKVSGKGLSTNDYTADEKTKLSGIEEGAEVNVQSDWSVTDSTSDAYIKNKPSLATVATSGKYSDLTGTPTIPTVNNGTLTIQKNGTTVKTFTANSSSNVTANITVPTKVSELTNDSNYATTSQLPTVNNGKLTIKVEGTEKGSFTANQSTASEINIQASDLGLTGAMKFIGKFDTLPETTNYEAGNVIIVGSKEYILIDNSGTKSWDELGDESSHALKSVTITGTGALSGGGNLEANRTITHTAGSAANKSSGLYKFSTDAYSHIGSVTAVTKSDITALGIPASDTNTTYTLTQDSTDGHKLTFTPSSGTATTITIPDNNDNTTYTFANGTTNNILKITPSSGSATTVTINDVAHATKADSATSATSATYTNYLGTSSANYTKSTLDTALNSKASSSHTHDISLSKEGTSTIDLAGSTTYTLTAGGKSIAFKTPSSGGNYTGGTDISIGSDNSINFTNASGYTKNTGTVTSVAVKMNGTTKGTITSSGTIDLGTVITDISGKQDKGNYISYTDNTATVAGTSKTVSKTSPSTLYVSDGLVIGGTAQAVGLVTRGICGVSTPDSSTGACTKDNLYINYDGTSSYAQGRKVVLGAGEIGSQIGTTTAYTYTAVRGDEMVAYSAKKGSATGASSPSVTITDNGHTHTYTPEGTVSTPSITSTDSGHTHSFSATSLNSGTGITYTSTNSGSASPSVTVSKITTTSTNSGAASTSTTSSTQPTFTGTASSIEVPAQDVTITVPKPKLVYDSTDYSIYLDFDSVDYSGKVGAQTISFTPKGTVSSHTHTLSHTHTYDKTTGITATVASHTHTYDKATTVTGTSGSGKASITSTSAAITFTGTAGTTDSGTTGISGTVASHTHTQS